MIKTYNRLEAAFPEEGVTVDVGGPGRRRHARPRPRRRSRQLVQRAERLTARPARAPRSTYSQRRHRRRGLDPDQRQRQRRGIHGRAQSRSATRSSRRRSVGSRASTVNVTGDAAASKDFRDQLNSRLPLIFAFVFALSFLLMLVTFRSIVIPIKAILLNLLSVGAAYGVLVLVFQDGHGESRCSASPRTEASLVAAAVPVRDPVRAVDGLPRVHPHPDPGSSATAG